MNKIILEADTKLEDKVARKQISKQWIDIEKINKRTKIHTLEIRELRKIIKELEKRLDLCQRNKE